MLRPVPKKKLRGATKGYVSEKFRPHIKTQLRQEYLYNHTKKKERYKACINNPEISTHCWSMMKTLDCDLEPHKKHMIKMLHNALPTKAKVWKNISKELHNNEKNGTNNTFWQDKYEYIKDDLCPLCGKCPETPEHLIACTHDSVCIARELVDNIKRTIAPPIIWFHTNDNFNNTELTNFDPILGSMGLITNQIADLILPKSTNAVKDKKMLSIQTYIMDYNLKVWKLRNAKLFAQHPRKRKRKT